MGNFSWIVAALEERLPVSCRDAVDNKNKVDFEENQTTTQRPRPR